MDLAVVLARIEGERYRSILPSEYVAYAREITQSCPNLSAAIDLNRRIIHWVQSSILDLTSGVGQAGLDRRAEIKRFFVLTAKVCPYDDPTQASLTIPRRHVTRSATSRR